MHSHRGVKDWIGDLNACYRREPALYECDFDGAGFEWVDCDDADNSVLVYLRRPRAGGDLVLIACNFTPVPRTNYRIGVPRAGHWRELLNSDAPRYGGSGMGNFGGRRRGARPSHGRFQSINVDAASARRGHLQERGSAVSVRRAAAPGEAASIDGRARVIIEGVTPQVDGGRFPIKRVVGESVAVEADVFTDGHDAVRAELCWRRDTEKRMAARRDEAARQRSLPRGVPGR